MNLFPSHVHARFLLRHDGKGKIIVLLKELFEQKKRHSARVCNIVSPMCTIKELCNRMNADDKKS